jgi:integrase
LEAGPWQQGELRIAQAKNHQFRVVPFTDRLRRLLVEMKSEATPHPKASVFEAVVDNRVIAAALKRAGISKDITLHGFRHLFATKALEAGMSSFHLQAIGGWKSPVMLERYGKRRNQALHDEMAKLNGFTQGTQNKEKKAI